MVIQKLSTDDRILIRDIVDMAVEDPCQGRIILKDPDLLKAFPFMIDIMDAADTDNVVDALRGKIKDGSIRNPSLHAIVRLYLSYRNTMTVIFENASD